MAGRPAGRLTGWLVARRAGVETWDVQVCEGRGGLYAGKGGADGGLAEEPHWVGSKGCRWGCGRACEGVGWLAGWFAASDLVAGWLLAGGWPGPAGPGRVGGWLVGWLVGRLAGAVAGWPHGGLAWKRVTLARDVAGHMVGTAVPKSVSMRRQA